MEKENAMTETRKTSESATAVEEIEALYVQTAEGVSYDDGRLTLHNVAPTTLFFSDRPDRVTGHVSSPEFVDTWGEGKDSFASDPPNAALSIFGDGQVHDVVVVLSDPVRKGAEITYTVEILDGEMPAKGGPSSLFIDVIGRPLSPVSVAGMRRREMRREFRR
jgi:hypothetical protein